MQDEFGVDLVQVIKGMSEQDLRKFIIYHEISHVENNDRSKYYEDTKQTIAGDKADLKNKFLADSAIRIEARANMDALKKLKLWNPKPKNNKKDTTANEELNRREAELKAKIKAENEKVLKSIGEQQIPTTEEVTPPKAEFDPVTATIELDGETIHVVSELAAIEQSIEDLEAVIDCLSK